MNSIAYDNEINGFELGSSFNGTYARSNGFGPIIALNNTGNGLFVSKGVNFSTPSFSCWSKKEDIYSDFGYVSGGYFADNLGGKGYDENIVLNKCSSFNILNYSFYFNDLCSDNDGGNNEKIRGAVNFFGNKFEDVCLSGSLLKEYFCEDKFTIENSTISCVNGCNNGKCLPTSV